MQVTHLNIFNQVVKTEFIPESLKDLMLIRLLQICEDYREENERLKVNDLQVSWFLTEVLKNK